MEHQQEENDMEDEIIALEERLASVKSDLESRIRLLEGSFEEEQEAESNIATVKLQTPIYPIPTAPNITDENFFNHPPPSILRKKSHRSSISEELYQNKVITPAERNSNRRSLNVDIIRPAPRYFPPKQQPDQNIFNPN